MNFEHINIISNNAIHQYFIQGKCKIFNAEANKLLVCIKLEDGVILHETIHSVEMNGIEFEFGKSIMESKVLLAEVKSINSFNYSKQFKS